MCGRTPAEIAAVIVKTLFTNGMGKKASRLVLFDDGRKTELGGWCREAVEDVIVQAITMEGRLAAKRKKP
jgi:hypothetical protein